MQYPQDLAVTVAAIGDSVSIVAEGELDAFTRSRLIRAVTGVVRCTDRVVVEVSGLTFVDATSYAALIDLAREADAGGTELVFRNPSRSLLRSRQLLDTGRVLNIEYTSRNSEGAPSLG